LIDFLPGVIPYESTIVAEFYPSGETVRMVVTLDPMYDEEFTKMQTEGFTRQLTKLDKRFASGHEGVTMREFIADLFISLDGFASGVNEAAFFGYFGDGLGKWIQDHLNHGQLLVMWRITYEALAGFTPSATDELSLRMTELPKLVFSSTLKEPLSWKNTRLVTTSAANEIRALKQKPGDPLRSIGSVSLVKSMMQLGLVDRLRLMVFPVVLGTGGREPIYAGYSQTGLELVDHKVLDSRIVLLEYRPVGSAAT
jgi:dihydrofolate reductase